MTVLLAAPELTVNEKQKETIIMARRGEATDWNNFRRDKTTRRYLTIKVAASLRSLVLASGCWTLGDFGFFLGVGRFGVE